MPKRIADAQEAARKAFRPLEHVGDNTTSSKERTKRVLHRIPIEEIGSDSEDEPQESSRDAANAKTAQAKASAAAAAAAAVPAPAPTKKKKKVAIVELDSDSDDEAAAGAKASSPAPAPAPSPTKAAVAAAAAPAPAAKQEAIVPKPAAAVKTMPKANKAPTPKKAVVPAALTSAKFESCWRQHQKNDDKIVELLRSFKPSQLPELIKQNISPEFVTVRRRVRSPPGPRLARPRLDIRRVWRRPAVPDQSPSAA